MSRSDSYTGLTYQTPITILIGCNKNRRKQIALPLDTTPWKVESPSTPLGNGPMTSFLVDPDPRSNRFYKEYIMGHPLFP